MLAQTDDVVDVGIVLEASGEDGETELVGLKVVRGENVERVLVEHLQLVLLDLDEVAHIAVARVAQALLPTESAPASRAAAGPRRHAAGGRPDHGAHGRRLAR